MSEDQNYEAAKERWHPNAPERPAERLKDFARMKPGRGRPTDVRLAPVDASGRLTSGFQDLEPPFPPPRDRVPAIGRLPLGEAGVGPSFSIDAFAANLRSRMAGNCTGWAFVINQNGQEARRDAGGKAILPSDTDGSGQAIGNRDFTADTRVQIASVSKTITAIAVLRLLQDTGIGLNAPVWPYLPQAWDFGPGMKDLTFRHLLSHTSGMTGVASTGLSHTMAQLAVELGASPGATPAYRNINFTLFRYIIPRLWAEADLPNAHADTEVAAGFFYAVYIIERIFSEMKGAIGDDASTSPLESRPARYYDSATSTTGLDFANYSMIAGASGWHMSARELAAIMAFLTYTDDLIDAPTRTVMDWFRLGWREPGMYQGAFGDYLGQGGFITRNWNGATGRTRTAVMKFGLQIEAALVANSEITGLNGSAGSILQVAYDAAWS